MPARFLNVPHIQQKSNADCLAACAAMMLEAAGFRADYNQLLRLFGTSELGTPSGRIELLSRLHSDLRVDYRVGDVKDIIDFIDAGSPVAIFVDTIELPYWSWSAYHAVVIVGYSAEDFYLHDPAFREPQVVSLGDLQLAWDAFNSKLAVVQRK